MVGSTPYATFEAAYAAAKVAGKAQARCRNGIEGTISGYAGSRSCSWRGAKHRTEMFNRLLSKAAQLSENRSALAQQMVAAYSALPRLVAPPQAELSKTAQSR